MVTTAIAGGAPISGRFVALLNLAQWRDRYPTAPGIANESRGSFLPSATSAYTHFFFV
jgi:hypothetical protein